MANTEGYRLVRCPKCINVLPEPANVAVYKCGGCGTTLRAKIRTSSGRHVAPKQVRQDSDSFSVATAESSGVPPRNNDEAASAAGAATGIADASSSTVHGSDSTRLNESGDHVQPAEKNAAGAVDDTGEKKDHRASEAQNDATSRSEEAPASDLARSNGNGSPLDSGEADNPAAEQCADNSTGASIKERVADDSERRLLSASENITTLDSERNRVTVVGVQGSDEQKGAAAGGETEHEANRRSYLVRAQSRSCGLRASGTSLDFHSARTSLQSKSFRAGEPLQSKIMNSVDELKGDLTELFSKPSLDCKPTRAAHAHPPLPCPKPDGYTSAPLAAAYRPAVARHATARLYMSGQQVAPRGGLPSPRYRRRRAYSGYPPLVVEQMERRPACWHECCHSCPPPCYSRSCATHEPAPPVKEVQRRRRPPPKHHCRPVLRGSPFVICSNCLKLVQLPTDFTVPSRGTRRLRCGSCSHTLSYSYRDPGRKKPPSPFGGDDGYSTTDGYYNETQYRPAAAEEQADPVSYSEEHGLSFDVSYSTSTEDGQPLYVSRNSSFNTVDEGMMARDGKLHRLMGYSSASELLRHSPDLFESFDGRTPPPPEARRAARDSGDRKGKGVVSHDYSGEPKLNNDSPVKTRSSKARRGGGLPLQGILKKGLHGLESLKLRS